MNQRDSFALKQRAGVVRPHETTQVKPSQLLETDENDFAHSKRTGKNEIIEEEEDFSGNPQVRKDHDSSFGEEPAVRKDGRKPDIGDM